MKILIDNNFFDRYGQCSDETRALVGRALKGRVYTLYVSTVLVEELLSLAASKRSHLLGQRCAWLLDVMRGRYLRPVGEIVRAELAGRRELFLEARRVKALDALLLRVSKGERPPELRLLIQERNQRRDSAFTHLHETQRRIRDVVRRELGNRRERISYEEFCGRYQASQRDHFVRPALELAGVRRTTAAEVFLQPLRYPYFHALLRLHAALEYLYFIEDRRVDAGDTYDVEQLTVLEGLDGIVTDDQKNLARVLALAYSGKRFAWTFEDFLRSVRESGG